MSRSHWVIHNSSRLPKQTLVSAALRGSVIAAAAAGIVESVVCYLW